VTIASAPSGALSGLRVLDLSRVLAGPWSTQILADLGADVVKVEAPEVGDDTRTWGPPFMRDGQNKRTDAAYFACCNRNKRSLTADFSTSEGSELIRGLAKKADILVENFKLNGLKKYGLDYTSLSVANPGLIYCSITGFGQSGPYAHRPGYDFLIQGMGGLMSITGQPDGQPGAEPVKVGVAVCDLFTGMNAATAILAAVHHRQKTGQGQHIDCGLLDSQIAMLANQASNWLNGAHDPVRMGNNHPNVVPYRVFEVADGHVIISCGNDRQFRKLCGALGLAELGGDPRFATNEKRVENRNVIDSLLGAEVLGRSKADVIACLEEAMVPCGPINTVEEVFDDPHVRARGAEVVQKRSDGTTIRSIAFPAHMSKSPATYRMAAPVLGEHTEEIMDEWLS